ncbi:MAG: outer membrane beta-barrel protein [Longimicrobiales bacterium]
MKAHRSHTVLLLATAVFALPASAQTLESYGVFGGLSRSQSGGGFVALAEDLGGVINPKYGIKLGGFAHFTLAPNTTLRGEMGLAQQGFRIPPENGLRERALDVNYLDFAGVVRRSFPQESVTPWVGAGPVISMRMSADGSVDEVSEDISDEISGSDFGLAVEVGASREVLDFGLRYVFGLTDINAVSDDADETIKNRGLALTVSYLIPR